MNERITPKVLLTILTVALGYFVDVYDLLLFSVVRVPSLKEIGLSDSDILSQGVGLLNIQMVGMLLGGIVFGVWADKKGRISVLFGSILLYSIATLLNAFVHTVEMYALLRFLAGFGLAGELGIGITLVSELLPASKRSYGFTIVGTIGMCGALIAWPITSHFGWRTSYIIGGVMGLCLLVLRLSVLESSLFQKAKETQIRRGQFLALFTNRARFFKFLACILLGIQLWFVLGILIALSPEFASQMMGIDSGISVGEAVFYCYIGVIPGGFLCGVLSQYLKSRKKVLALYMIAMSAGILGYFFLKNISATQFYSYCIFLGFVGGYGALFVQVAAEQFGTNLRATVSTSVTNFGRATLVPLSMLFIYCKNQFGLYEAGLGVGILTILISIWPIMYLKETFYRDLDYLDS